MASPPSAGVTVVAAALALAVALPAPQRAGAPPRAAVVGSATRGALEAALRRQPATLVRPAAARVAAAEPALRAPAGGAPAEWQYAATHADAVPEAVLRAAAAVTIAVVDTGADVAAPDIAAKRPLTHNVVTRGRQVKDADGHGTFVASLAAGAVDNGEGIAGFGGDARLLVVKANRGGSSFDDADEAAGIVWAVDHGARIVNLSVGGPTTSAAERDAIDYAADHGVLVVAAAGNDHDRGNPIEYPAALLQPVGSDGVGGRGLAVGASTARGTRAFFSNSGSYVSLVAPGVDVLGAVPAAGRTSAYSRVALPGSLAGTYGLGSGTSYAAPQVAGAAALVWAANPLLTAPEVAQILKETASGGGTWNPETGWGVLDVAAAVARAAGGAAEAAGPPRHARRLELP